MRDLLPGRVTESDEGWWTVMHDAARLLGDRFHVIDLIAHGGASDVYRAFDEHEGRLVAVKLLRGADPQLAARLAREVELLGRLQHPGLVRLLDTGTADGRTFLVMELVEGGTLADRLRWGPLGPEGTAALVATVAVGLDHAHAAGIVHRDVKPANILLDRSGRPYLCDFGIAQWLDTATLTATGTALGTAAYMAPEQLRGGPVGPAADVWSLGMVAMECLTGRRAYEGTGVSVVARRLAASPTVPSDLPARWRELIGQMLDDEPGRRPTTAAVAARTAGAGGAAGAAALSGTAPLGDVAAIAAVGAGRVGLHSTADAVTEVGLGPVTTQVPLASRGGRRRRGARAVAAFASVLVAALGAAAAFAASSGVAGEGGFRPASHVRQAPTTTTTPTTSAPTTSTTTTPPPPPPTVPPTSAPPPPPPPPTTAPAPASGPGHLHSPKH